MKLKNFTFNTCSKAGTLLLECFGKSHESRSKGDISNIVTDADLAVEALIVEEIRKSYPDDVVIGEETGFQSGSSEFTWVIDPLDGTSNFAASIPWFGVLLARFEGQLPVIGAIYLPLAQDFYYAESGSGAFRNDKRIAVSSAPQISETLWAYGMDAKGDEQKTLHDVEILGRLKKSVRNIRATNSLVDPCYVADGRFGGFINQCVKIWDIAAPAVVIKESGGVVTDLSGDSLKLELEDCERSYEVVGCAGQLHDQIISLIQGS